MASETRGVLLVGVGGQGVVLGSSVVAAALLDAGFDVKTSEVHGMAQRGGMVSSHLRFGERVASPLIPLGTADVLLAFEWAEALRWLVYLKPEGTLVSSVDSIVPPLACSDRRAWNSRYPAEHPATLRDFVGNLRLVEARRVAGELGNPKAASAVLFGVLSLLLEDSVGVESWERAIRTNVPKKALDVNLSGFRAGRELTFEHGRPSGSVPPPLEPRTPPAIELNQDWCKGCDICVRFCPEHCLALDEREKVIAVAPELCTGCRLCEFLCPDFAIAITPREAVLAGG